MNNEGYRLTYHMHDVPKATSAPGENHDREAFKARKVEGKALAIRAESTSESCRTSTSVWVSSSNHGKLGFEPVASITNNFTTRRNLGK